LAAIAKWLDESASERSPVSGERATTANFAEVVSGVPTSGERQKTIGASGESGAASAPPSCRQIQVPRPTPPT